VRCAPAQPGCVPLRIVVRVGVQDDEAVSGSGFRSIKSWAIVAGTWVVGPVPLAWAEGPGVSGDPVLAEHDGEDHHHRPAEYQNPDIPLPPASNHAEYPLAAGFIPADSSNYTAGGIASYEYVVVHTMQGYYGGSISWFQNPSSNVSAHYVMRADDGEITQMVHNTDRAWHVGNSNSYALGIEHEGFIDDASWYTWATYLSSARLARWLCDTYGIPADRDHIVGHVELPSQTHTDPGPNWNWDLYMALVRDVVSQGRVEGVVVDETAACSIVANTDTVLKATLQPAGELGADEACAIAAGVELTYYWASDDIYGHRRLTLAADGPCVGLGDLEYEGFVFAEHFDGLCPPDELLVPDASITVDGGAVVEQAVGGRFAIDGIEAGAHTLDVHGSDGFEDTFVPVDVDVYPGARVVIVLDPTRDGSDSGGSGTTSDGSSSTSDPGESGTSGADVDPDDDAGSSSDPGGSALPGGYGERGADSACACRTRPGDRPTRAWLVILGVLGLRRRRAC
jgi:hypothetical protein